MPVTLHDLFDIPRPGWNGAGSLDEFVEHPLVVQLGWPVDVVRQWLWEHGRNGAFLDDYGSVDLAGVRWSLDLISTAELVMVPTGPSDGPLLEEQAADHARLLSKRPDSEAEWEANGSWLVPPVLIDRDLLDPPGKGLQVVEGRTRLSVLRGRTADVLRVAPSHAVWAGRRRPAPSA